MRAKQVARAGGLDLYSEKGFLWRYPCTALACLGFVLSCRLLFHRPAAPALGLRGGAEHPAAFDWLGDSEGVVGVPLSIRVLALDRRGRPLRGAALAALNAGLTVVAGGSAQVLEVAGGLKWERGELHFEVQDRVAEAVEVRLALGLSDAAASAGANATSRQIRFRHGPPVSFTLSLRPTIAGAPGASCTARRGAGANVSCGSWSVHTILEASVSAEDVFGNPVAPAAGSGSDGSLCSEGLRLRASDLLDLQPSSAAGAGTIAARRLRVLGSPGAAEVWLEESAGAGPGTWAAAPGRSAASWTISLLGPDTRMPEGLPSADRITGDRSGLSEQDAKWQRMANEVREAFLHAWYGYRRHAWGSDELQPVSKTGKDTFGNVGMTVIDSLTTLWLMGLSEEFEVAMQFVRDDLDFDNADREVSVFEVVIRALGGLLGAHALSGRAAFLARAQELGERLLPALNTSSRMPWPRWNIARGGGGTSNSEMTILAEVGSLQLEFRYLSAVTGDLRFARAADACFQAIQGTGVQGLLPVHLTPSGSSGRPRALMEEKVAVGALADSYYEYLLKQWLQSPADANFKELFLTFMTALPTLVRPSLDDLGTVDGAPVPKFKLVEIAHSQTVWKMDHLSCFVPGTIALGLMTLPDQDLAFGGRRDRWRALAEGLTESCVELWTGTKTGLAPEFASLDAAAPHGFTGSPHGGLARRSFLRPETAESLFYMYRLTGDAKYRRWGKKMFKAIVEHAKVDAGFASVWDIDQVPTVKLDEMQSFVMAETFKYLFLLFSPASALDLDRFVLNTEAHPLRRLGPL